ncbi:MAG: NTP transferase domain-containing protein [Planctomycetota bacterium]
MPRPLAVVVLAAGLGTRTKVPFPKVLLPLCGRTLLRTVLDTTAELEPERTVVVVHHGKDQVVASVAGLDVTCVDQGEPMGTGHAAQVAMEVLAGFEGDLLLLYGDGALITAETLRRLRDARGDQAVALLTAHPLDPTGLGRILRDEQGDFVAIREERDCSDTERVIDEVNSGFYCFDAGRLPAALAALTRRNAQAEYYLTDTVGWFAERGDGVVAVATEDPDEVQAVNSLDELALARSILQERILLQHLHNGVIIEDPATTYIEGGVAIGRGTRVLPCTVIHAGCRIGEGCEVGPFSHLRPGAILEDGAEVGNFVEVKKSVIGKHSKAKHLTYLGDTTIGERANIGAGTITANYDGKHKHPTVIGDRAFLGSGTVVVAPAKIGDDAITGAGAVLTRDTEVGEGEVYIGVPARPLNRAAPLKGTGPLKGAGPLKGTGKEQR